MSLKKYSIFVALGLSCGILLAYFYSFHVAKPATRNIASYKADKLNPRKIMGKPGASLFVQITKLEESDPARGYYKLMATVTFNQPMNGIRFQWALPPDARLISDNSDLEGQILLAQGEESIEKIIELQLTDTKRDSQILFDLNYYNGDIPMGTSDIYVFRASPL